MAKTFAMRRHCAQGQMTKAVEIAEPRLKDSTSSVNTLMLIDAIFGRTESLRARVAELDAQEDTRQLHSLMSHPQIDVRWSPLLLQILADQGVPSPPRVRPPHACR